jgi:hypothetical protein
MKRSLLLILLGLCSLLDAVTNLALVHPLHTKLAISLERLHLISHLDQLNRALLRYNGHVLSRHLGCCCQLLRCRITSLEFAVLPWEDNKFSLVGLEALNISLEALQRTVLPAVVHCYANCWCHLLRYSSSLELLKREAPPSTRLHVVLESLALHNWAKRAGSWTWEDLHCLLLSSSTSPGFASRLVEPGADIVLPMLLEVAIWNHIVMLHHVYLPSTPGRDVAQV